MKPYSYIQNDGGYRKKHVLWGSNADPCRHIMIFGDQKLSAQRSASALNVCAVIRENVQRWTWKRFLSALTELQAISSHHFMIAMSVTVSNLQPER